MSTKPTLLALWAYLTGVFFTLFARSHPVDAGEWFLWIVAAVSFLCMTASAWSDAQMEVLLTDKEWKAEEYRQLHKAFSYDIVIEHLLREERYEDAAKISEARSKIDLP